MTPQQIDAMKLALDALKNNKPTHLYCEDIWYSCPKHEDGCANEAEGDECNCGADEINAEFDKAITALEEALAEHAIREVQRLGQEIEQEPVAHCKVRPLRGDESFPKVEIDWVNQPVPGPLYTSPAQRKPLTGEQIFALENSIPDEVVSDRDWCIHFARAIEAAHDIKENT